MVRLRMTRGLVAATLLMLVVAASAEASNAAKKDPSVQHAQSTTVAVAAPQIIAVSMYQAEVLYQAQTKEDQPARFEGTLGAKAANKTLWTNHRGEYPPEATASPSSMLNTQTTVNRSFISVNFASTYTGIGNKLPRAFAAANNSAKNGIVLRI